MKTASNNTTADRRLFSEEILSLCLYYRNEQESEIYSKDSSDVAHKWRAERESQIALKSTQESVSVGRFTNQVCKRLRAAGREDLSESYRNEIGIFSDPVKQMIRRVYLKARVEAGSRAERIEDLLSEYPNKAERIDYIDREILKQETPIVNTAEGFFDYNIKHEYRGEGDLINKFSALFSCLLSIQHREADQQDEEDIFDFYYRKTLREQLRMLRKRVSDGRTLRKLNETELIPYDFNDAITNRIFYRAMTLGVLQRHNLFADRVNGKKITLYDKRHFIEETQIALGVIYRKERIKLDGYAAFFGLTKESLSQCKSRNCPDPDLQKYIDSIFKDLN